MEEKRSASVERTVTEEMTALRMGSGSLEVLATPALAALMEAAACAAVEGMPGDGQTSVGTALNLQHTSATPVGMRVRCTATLVSLEGRKLVFEISASDEKGEIARAVHERFLVYGDRFLEKARRKLVEFPGSEC